MWAMCGGADSSPMLTMSLFGGIGKRLSLCVGGHVWWMALCIMYVVSLGLLPVLSMLQIYYLARGRQFVSAYALSMLLVVKHILLIVNFSHLLHISVNLGKLYLSL